ncbi:MAG: hypothetical protein GEU90_08705 [Gemmatimonas sp.]|nr:hypothetical protein [Gemmatimonas sp.]
MTRNRWFFGLVAAQLAFAGCWPFGQEEEPAGPGPAEGPPLVEVTNMHWAPVNIYAIHSGTSLRLGTLTTNQTERFELPSRLEMGGDVRFIVDPVGATYRYTSDAVFAQSGLVIVLRVENNLNLSSISIR